MFNKKEVSVVIPTYNRGYIINDTLPTYINAFAVGEIIIVSDGSTDNTKSIIQKFTRENSDCSIFFIEHNHKMGAAAARHTGTQNATLKYVMFGEDDVYLDQDYASKLLTKLLNQKYQFASGRIVYLQKNESLASSKIRFGYGLNDTSLINYKNFRVNQEKTLNEDCETIFSHALYLAERSTLKSLGFDQFYRNGAGYREETDTQVRGYLQGMKHLIVHDAFCFHMNFEDTPSGGQRIKKINQWYWNIRLNNYFLNKNFADIKKINTEITLGINSIKLYFFIDQTRVFIIHPLLIKLRFIVIKTIKIFLKKRT
jgi:glycosyltransferase involved in cell wall biosynthesis